jgi:hypothetical protein
MTYNAIIFTDTRQVLKVRALGAYVIADTLRTNGYTALVIDHFIHIDIKIILNLISKFVGKETFFVGYSSSLFQSSKDPVEFLGRPPLELEAINKLIKLINPNTQIIFGGAYSKLLCKVNLKHRKNFGIDYAMHGYSEGMIVDFIKNCETNQPQRISNKYNDLKEIDYDLKGDSFNYRDSRHSWHATDFIEDEEALPIEISRGCIFKCKFCAYPLLGKRKDDNSYIKHEETLLTEFLENYEKYKTLNYMIVDDTFNERIDKIEMMVRVRDRSKLNLSFTGYNRLDLIHRKPEQLQLLKDMNFVGHLFGIESLNHQSAKIIGKGMQPEHVHETLYKIKELFNGNVSLTGSFIIGLPYETQETFQKWFDEISSPDYPLDRINIRVLALAENTHSKSEFLSNPERYGYDISSPNNWKNSSWDRNTCDTIAEACNTKLIDSGKNKMGSMISVAASSFGFDFHTIAKTSEKDFNPDKFQKLLNVKRETYINKLRNL